MKDRNDTMPNAIFEVHTCIHTSYIPANVREIQITCSGFNDESLHVIPINNGVRQFVDVTDIFVRGRDEGDEVSPRGVLCYHTPLCLLLEHWGVVVHVHHWKDNEFLITMHSNYLYLLLRNVYTEERSYQYVVEFI